MLQTLTLKVKDDDLGIELPLYLKLYTLKQSNKEPYHILRELIQRLITTSMVSKRPVNSYSMLSLITYKRYMNPEIYTSYEDYLVMYTQYNIRQNFGLTFIEFINMYIIDIIPMLRVAKKINEEKANTMNDLNKQMDILKGELDD